MFSLSLSSLCSVRQVKALPMLSNSKVGGGGELIPMTSKNVVSTNSYSFTMVFGLAKPA